MQVWEHLSNEVKLLERGTTLTLLVTVIDKDVCIMNECS